MTGDGGFYWVVGWGGGGISSFFQNKKKEIGSQKCKIKLVYVPNLEIHIKNVAQELVILLFCYTIRKWLLQVFSPYHLQVRLR